MVTEAELRNEIKILVVKYNGTNSKSKKRVIFLEITMLETHLDKMKK
jgi:hypothetical protein